MTGGGEPARPLEVVAGALVDAHGRVLIASRPPGKSFAGRWEFPGGKRQPGETARAALERELAEELGIAVTAAEPLLAVRHRYPGAHADVCIEGWRVTAWRGEPRPLDGQALRWCPRAQLPDADLLEADRALVTALVLPPTFVRVPAEEPLAERVPVGPRTGRVAWLVGVLPSDAGVVRRLEEHGDAVFVLDPRSPPAAGAGSVYGEPQRFERATQRHRYAGRVVQSAEEAAAAAAAGADFLLVPVRDLGPDACAAIAALGVPWYLDAESAAEAAGATGRL
ncbi:MAG: (deoxy)nucleoside triphosphate pyrophosphohydrolase, partial [Proteobacteria bacterium]|nr:(deoxy)nucleoside triphosphate pyrophosphohydrolase [Pseudomonadota bacterium]